jgi:hypothetical protein
MDVVQVQRESAHKAVGWITTHASSSNLCVDEKGLAV